MFCLSKSEIRQLLAAIDLRSPFGRRDYLLILFLYHTGLRDFVTPSALGECAGLITHLVAKDLKPRQYLHLPATICKGVTHLRWVPGRVVPLNAVAQKCITKILELNRDLGLSTAPAAPLFQNRCHGPVSVRSQAEGVPEGPPKAHQVLPGTSRSRSPCHPSPPTTHLRWVPRGYPDATPTLPTWPPPGFHKPKALPPRSVYIQKGLGHRRLSSTQVYSHVSKEQLLASYQALGG